MARVTVEDCVDKVENRFELVLLAGHRARQISQGAQITIDRDNDKNPVVALREIADETLSPDDLKEDLIHSLRSTLKLTNRKPLLQPRSPTLRMRWLKVLLKLAKTMLFPSTACRKKNCLPVLKASLLQKRTTTSNRRSVVQVFQAKVGTSFVPITT